MVFFGLLLLFFTLFCYFSLFIFPLPPPPGNFSADTLAHAVTLNYSNNFLLTRDSSANHLSIVDKNAYFLFKILQFLLVRAQKILLLPGSN